MELCPKGLTLLRIFCLLLSNNGNNNLQVSRKYVSVKKTYPQVPWFRCKLNGRREITFLSFSKLRFSLQWRRENRLNRTTGGIKGESRGKQRGELERSIQVFSVRSRKLATFLLLSWTTVSRSSHRENPSLGGCRKK